MFPKEMETKEFREVKKWLLGSFLDSLNVPSKCKTREERERCNFERKKIYLMLMDIRRHLGYPKNVIFKSSCSEEDNYKAVRKKILSKKPKYLRGRVVRVVWIPSGYIYQLKIYYFDNGVIIEERDPWNIEGIWYIGV
jgi:hypothetical protein